MSMIEMPKPDQALISKKDEVVRMLVAAIGEVGVIHEPEETLAYECDALTAYRCPPLAVCLPASTEEVAAVLKICRRYGLPVIPRGSGTSLAGGCSAHRRFDRDRCRPAQPDPRNRL